MLLACVAACTSGTRAAEVVLLSSTVDGGGGRSQAGTVTATGTLGQSDAGPLFMTAGATYRVAGGFWQSVSTPGTPGTASRIFHDGFE